MNQSRHLFLVALVTTAIALAGCSTPQEPATPEFPAEKPTEESDPMLENRSAAPVADGPGPSGAEDKDPEPPAEEPQEIVLYATEVIVHRPPVEWDRVAEFLPDGWQPRAPPDIPDADGWVQIPPGIVADVMVLVFDYENATVDGTELPGGLLAAAYAGADPPPEWDYRPYPGELRPNMAARVWIGAVATDADLAEALSSWEIEAAVGDVSLEQITTGVHTLSITTVAGGPLEFTAYVQTTSVSDAHNSESVVVHYSAKDGEVIHPMFDHQSKYRVAFGSGQITGTLGDLGEVNLPPIISGKIWFGPNDTEPGKAAPWRYNLVDPPE